MDLVPGRGSSALEKDESYDLQTVNSRKPSFRDALACSLL